MHNRRRLAEIIILFGVTFVPGYFAQSSGEAGAWVSAALESWYYHVQYALMAVPQIALILFIMSSRGAGWRARYGFAGFTAGSLGYGLLTCLVLFVAPLPIQVLVPRLTGSGQPSVWEPSSAFLLIPAAVTMILGAFREEAFFRSYLLTEMGEYGVAKAQAIVGSAVLFGLGHIYQGIAGFVSTTVMGIILGYIYYRRRNVFEIIIGHAAYNIAVLAIWIIAPR